MGASAPKPSGGRRHAKLEPHRAFLLAQVAEKADITMPELAGALAAARGEKADPASLSRWLIRAGYRFNVWPAPSARGFVGLAADPVCINVSGLEELPPAMMEIRTLRS